MTIREIIVQRRDTETHISRNVTLDGVTVRLDTYTNKADSSWYLDVFDANDSPLVQGIALVAGLDLLFPYKYLDIPPGILFVNDHLGTVDDPTLSTFIDQEASLYYQEAGS
jgi:hypothetical protein